MEIYNDILNEIDDSDLFDNLIKIFIDRRDRGNKYTVILCRGARQIPNNYINRYIFDINLLNRTEYSLLAIKCHKFALHNYKYNRGDVHTRMKMLLKTLNNIVNFIMN